MIHYDFSKEKEYKTPLNTRNQKFLEYMDRFVSGDRDMDALLSEETDAVILQNLSDLKGGIVSFYNFKEQASVLEIGASFGAVTDLLLRKCSRVTVTEKSVFRSRQIEKRFQNTEEESRLQIYVGDVQDMTFDEKFDYVILNGILEKVGNGSTDSRVYSEYLLYLKSLLKDDGIVLFTVDNRLGLKYLCGGADPYTGKAFSGLNGYPDGSSGRLFTKNEIESIVSGTGLSCKFYYPLPDYKFPQLIYTDRCLPEKNLKERLIPYYFRKDTLVFDELSLYYDVASNGGFPFVANSFLVECAKEETSFSDITYAAISTDRGKEYSFATSIHEGGYVTKDSIYEQGSKAIDRLYSNTMDLEAHGIPVVSHSLMNKNSLKMDYVSSQTLSNYIKDIIATRPEEVIRILDQIYDYILQSSEVVGEGEDGPILKKAYLELIPLNCFYKEGAFLFFDQEYVKENCPAKYVLFRAIHYIYCFTPNAQQYIKMQELKDRYGMNETWENYLQMEKEFLDTVRNHKKYAWFYRYAYSDKNKIKENSMKLASETEKKSEYVISDKMKKTWKVELAMLDAFDRICKKYDLTYYIVHGTLLGAVRHKGFIPWDDDLDVAMKREDYEKFVKVAPSELSAPLCLVTPTSEKEYWWGPFYRIMDLNTAAISPFNLEREGRQGIWMDILPLDSCTADEEKLNKKLRRLKHFHRLMHAKIYGKGSSRVSGMSVARTLWYKLLSLTKSREQIYEKLNATMQLYTEEPCKDIATFTGYEKVKVYNAADFESVTFLDFEGRKLPAPSGYKDYLFRCLGGDYMKLPPMEERKPKHRGIFDPARSYTQYVQMLSGTFKDTKGKKIILFGSGLMFEDYMKKYGDKYKPFFIVDNDENKWERRRMGIEIKKPEAILEVPASKRCVIICSYYYKEIAPQLEKMGIKDYKVYVQEMEWILKSEEEDGEKFT